MVHEISDPSEFDRQINQKKLVVVDFSASWCGPCRMIAPAFDSLSRKYPNIVFLKVMEDTNKELIIEQGIRAFPTFLYFIEGRKVDEVRGANINKVEEKVLEHMSSVQTYFEGDGFSLGGGHSSEFDARAARLAKFGSSVPSNAIPPTIDPSIKKLNEKLLAADRGEDDPRFSMKSAVDPNPQNMDIEATEVKVRALRKVDAELVRQLTEDMGFPEGRAKRALALAPSEGIEPAIEWLAEHQEEADVDDILSDFDEKISENNDGKSASSLKCDDCGAVLKDMVVAELHAHKTGHANFSESTEEIKPLSSEEKALKVAQLKEKLAQRRIERESKEKAESTIKEKTRRLMGKEMRATKEEMEAQARMREIQLRKKEKLEAQRERERLREEIAKDKAERKARGGKLAGKLGVEGYQPVGLQHIEESHPNKDQSQNKDKNSREENLEAAKKCIGLLSRQKVGGEGGVAMKTILIYTSNILAHPEEEKYHSIGLDNKAFKARVVSCVGGVGLLKAIGFEKNEAQGKLVLSIEKKDQRLVGEIKDLLEKALAAYK